MGKILKKMKIDGHAVVIVKGFNELSLNTIVEHTHPAQFVIEKNGNKVTIIKDKVSQNFKPPYHPIVQKALKKLSK